MLRLAWGSMSTATERVDVTERRHGLRDDRIAVIRLSREVLRRGHPVQAARILDFDAIVVPVEMYRRVRMARAMHDRIQQQFSNRHRSDEVSQGQMFTAPGQLPTREAGEPVKGFGASVPSAPSPTAAPVCTTLAFSSPTRGFSGWRPPLCLTSGTRYRRDGRKGWSPARTGAGRFDTSSAGSR